MFLHINVVPKAFIISVVFVYSNVFPTCDFFIYKLNRCKYVSFKKSVNLSLMKVPFRATGLFGNCSKVGLLSFMFLFSFSFFLLLIRDGKVRSNRSKIPPFWYYSGLFIFVVLQIAWLFSTQQNLGQYGDRVIITWYQWPWENLLS